MFKNNHRLVILIAFGIVCLGPDTHAFAAPKTAVVKSSAATDAIARWHVTETRNFRVHSFGRPLYPEVAQKCEDLRSAIAEVWFDSEEDQVWEPKCDLVLHGTFAAYQSAVGTFARCTAACCTIEPISETTSRRRIDVRADRSGWMQYLPHEFTHLLCDGRLTAGRPPRWVDEGMALLADPPAKRAGHERELRTAMRSGRLFRLTELLTMSDYPCEDGLAAFYGQSLSIVKFLVDREGHDTFVVFVQQATLDGYDAALQAIYGIRDVRELDRLWLAHLQGSHWTQRLPFPPLKETWQ